MSLIGLKIVMASLLAVAVVIAALIAMKARPAFAGALPRLRLPSVLPFKLHLRPSQPAPARSADRAGGQPGGQVRRRGLIARTAGELELARLADQQLQYGLHEQGYYHAMEGWLEQLFERLLDRHPTPAGYKALLDLQAGTANLRLQQIRDGDEQVDRGPIDAIVRHPAP